jgi:hypothetical protein
MADSILAQHNPTCNTAPFGVASKIDPTLEQIMKYLALDLGLGGLVSLARCVG